MDIHTRILPKNNDLLKLFNKIALSIEFYDIKSLENIIKCKKELIPIIKERLLKVNYLKYEDSMQSLIFKDVEKILDLIK